jgi:hypothetical protein
MLRAITERLYLQKNCNSHMKLDDDPEPLDGRYLGKISADFVRIAPLLRQASYQMRVRGLSDHPIFPMSRHAQPIGGLLYAAGGALTLEWNYYLSYLDEFIQRGLITEEGLDIFKENFRDPEEFCCLCVVDEDFTNFVFIPYPTDEDGQPPEDDILI